MRLAPKLTRNAAILASCFLLIGLAAQPGLGDEPQGGRLGRLFRFGGNSPGSSATTPPPGHNHDAPAMAKPMASVAAMAPSTAYVTPTSPSIPPSTPELNGTSPSPRISAQPRVSRPPTESDPIVSRVSIGRSDSGGQFGMFLQVFADGTVLDSEGVHRVSAEVMKPLVEALRQGDLYRLKGHCGAPSTDFIEQAHVVLFERSYGKLKATSFSYSGNPQGCDPSVRKLHAALEAIQLKLSGPASVASPAPGVASPMQAPTPSQPGGPVLSLTPPGP